MQPMKIVENSEFSLMMSKNIVTMIENNAMNSYVEPEFSYLAT